MQHSEKNSIQIKLEEYLTSHITNNFLNWKLQFNHKAYSLTQIQINFICFSLTAQNAETMSLPRDFTVPHNVRCAYPIYFPLKITDLKPSDIICQKNVCLYKLGSRSRSLKQVSALWGGVNEESCDRLNKSILFPFCYAETQSFLLVLNHAIR